MLRFTFRLVFLATVFFSFISTAPAASAPAIDWQPWSDDVFAKAKAENRFVLLDLGAVWCHWCHVMEEITYRDPAVIALLRSRYIAVHVDQDGRPDLANRYEDYGWPATIVFNADRGEIVKRRGYMPPKEMASLLQAIIDDPTPGPSVEPEKPITLAADAALGADQRAQLREKFLAAYDSERGGWGDVHKYLNWDALEYCLAEGAHGDARLEKMARQTLTAGLKLIDPAWGGVYQYSTDGDWDHPHFEKIMPFQTENLRIFALAHGRWGEGPWLKTAQKIRAYLKTFLTSPDGAFFTSQDADIVQGEHSGEYFALGDAARRAHGIPRIDRHIYARENGLAITGLATLYAASGDASCLDDARGATDWVMAHRALPGGGFRHDEKDVAGPYLADSLAMARAFLQLYAVTADRAWLRRADETTAFIDTTFRSTNGFASSDTGTFAPKPQVDENLVLARFANLLHRYTGKAAYRQMAEHAMRFLAAPQIVEERGFGGGGVLLADAELRAEPLHVTVVGAKDDAAAKALFVAALKQPASFSRIEWWDPREGPLPNADVPYPEVPKAAAFLCANGSCSRPIQDAQELARKLRPSK